ncbi:hypothetical protein VULLAG_LOCUS10361 [Vulpes lagopus]
MSRGGCGPGSRPSSRSGVWPPGPPSGPGLGAAGGGGDPEGCRPRPGLRKTPGGLGGPGFFLQREAPHSGGAAGTTLLPPRFLELSPGEPRALTCVVAALLLSSAARRRKRFREAK